MKARKKFSIMLSALLTLNLFNGSILKANAAELTNDITLKSVSVSEKLITPGSEEKVTIEASDPSANLNKDAYAVYVSKSSGSEVEKEVALAMDDTDKKYHASISIKNASEAGDWKLSFITIGDEAGNVKIFYNSNVHQELGQDLSSGDYKVIVDNDAPKLGTIKLSSNSLVKGSTLKVQIDATDAGIGLADEANLTYVTKTASGDVEKPVTLKLLDGKYEGSLYVDDSFPQGDWKLSFITLEDKIGNVGILYNSNVHGSELGTDLSAGDFKVKPDTDSPKFASINVDKKIVKLGDKVNVTVAASDESSLAKEANLCYVVKSDKGDVEKGLTLNLVDGKYQGTIEMDDTLTSGTLSPSFITLEDSLGNVGVVYNSKVHGDMGEGLSADMSAGDIKAYLVNPDKPEIVLSTEAPTNKAVEVAINTKVVNGKVEYKLDGQAGWTTYTGKFNVNDNTTVYARVYDEAGNLSAEAEKKITNIDKVAPVVTITGVENGEVYNKPVKPVISTDDSDAVINATLNGAPYDGKEISEGGTYSLKVVATDKAGNPSVQQIINFTIDPTAPTIIINGVEDGKAYKTDVKPEVTVNGKECTVKVLLNGEAFDNGKTLTDDGSYKLVVTVVDGFNKEYNVEKKFTIDKKKPIVTISGVADNGYYKKVTIGTSNNEKVPMTVTLNGKPFTGNDVAADGYYVLKATATDAAGNTSDEVIIHFVIDQTKPVISVLGLEDGGVYNSNIHPVYKVQDTNEGTTEVTLNSKLYDEKPITAEGSYEYKVVATDKAGNISTAVYKFTIQYVVPKDADKVADTIKDLVKNTKDEKVVLNGTDNPVLNAKVFEAIKGIDKPVSVTVESQGITLTWTFNGKDVTDTTKSVDLTLNAVAPNKDLITKVDSNAEIISFKNHGVLPAPMTVTIPVDTKKFDVTKPINFYYYNDTTKKAELIAENLKAYQKGDAYFVDVTITHCSDYFLSASDSKTVLPKVEKLVQTGSPLDMNVLVGLGILLIGTGFVVVLARRKRS